MRPVSVIKYIGLPIAGVALIYSLLLFAYPPGAAGMLALVGRSPQCGVVEAVVGGHRLYWSYRGYSKQVNDAARLVGKDAAAGLQVVETSEGRFWEPVVEGSAVTAQIAEIRAKYHGLRESVIRPGDIVLDCGANVGVFTREALRRGARLVVAIEPAPVNIECLRRNLADEISAGRVILYEKGVWDREEMLRLRENESTSAMDGFVKGENTRDGPLLPLTTIDNLVRELKLDRVDFVKMDIEGAERRALRGAMRTLAQRHPRLEISVNHLPDDPVVVPAIIRSAWSGYGTECLLCSLAPMQWKVKADMIYFRP
ncbi:MAG: FkbM family methyltransferase [Bryobacteraceae bacterium]